jgi:hypothetical protein
MAAGPFGLQAARRWAPWGDVGEAELEVGAAPSPVPQSRSDARSWRRVLPGLLVLVKIAAQSSWPHGRTIKQIESGETT